MSVRIGINGFGRVGRCALRSAVESGAPVTWAGINDVADVELLAHLLRRDTVYGPFPGTIRVLEGVLVVDGVEIAVSSASDPAQIPWKTFGADVVLECTGRFRTREDAARHLAAGARKVIVSAPGKNVDATIVRGVNDEALDPFRHEVISNASCTTNCLAPVVKVLHDAFGIERGSMTTVHAVTGDQRVVDAPHKDPRRARAASGNIVPTSTGAAKAIGLVVPELEGRLHGMAARVPVLTGSLVDLTVELSRDATAEQLNEAFAAAEGDRLAGILHLSHEPLVSSDVIKSPYSAVVDAGLTVVTGGTQAKVVAWYDNEWAYATRLVELALEIGAPVPALVA
ncbi:MAG TPA: type I glyceraldehyde-3-phosphate dehydrogenase [Gaiellaceae bacterium]|jgi:glyceraldehyde 3-phosphate dehydrogenase|nr:type I glyceraldehyde-3-phosphate dehydrogenase [Gaiellaceae bacterium]